MKKLVLLFFVVLLSAVHLSASNAGLFKIDEVQLAEEMRGVNELESFVLQNEGVTLTELNTSPSLRASLSQEALALVDGMNLLEPPLGIPSFCWGGCLGWVGILITYLVTDQDKDETTKALYGCLAQGVCGILIYVVYIFWLVSVFATY